MLRSLLIVAIPYQEYAYSGAHGFMFILSHISQIITFRFIFPCSYSHRHIPIFQGYVLEGYPECVAKVYMCCSVLQCVRCSVLQQTRYSRHDTCGRLEFSLSCCDKSADSWLVEFVKFRWLMEFVEFGSIVEFVKFVWLIEFVRFRWLSKASTNVVRFGWRSTVSVTDAPTSGGNISLFPSSARRSCSRCRRPLSMTYTCVCVCLCVGGGEGGWGVGMWMCMCFYLCLCMRVFVCPHPRPHTRLDFTTL